MSLIPNYVPTQYKTLNVVLAVRNADKALEFYNRAFGAEVETCLRDPNGRIAHAEIKITDTLIILTEEDPEMNPSPLSLGGSSVTLQLYTGDVEGIFEDVIRAGGEVISPIRIKVFGDRSGKIRDPFGHQWIISTHMEDLTAPQLQERWHELQS